LNNQLPSFTYTSLRQFGFFL